MKVDPEGQNSTEFFRAHYNAEAAIPLPPPKEPIPKQTPKVKPVKAKPVKKPKPKTKTNLPLDEKPPSPNKNKAEELPLEPRRPPGNPTGNNGTPGQADHQELKRLKLKEDIEKVRIDNERKRGALFPKVLIKRVFGRLHSIDENQFKILGTSVSPGISAIYNKANTEKTKQILSLFKKEDDKELKKEINKILNIGETDRILEMTNLLEDKTNGILKAIKREIDKFLKNLDRLKE